MSNGVDSPPPTPRSLSRPAGSPASIRMRSTSSRKSVDRHGLPLIEVGHGIESVPVDLLKSLYLTRPGSSSGQSSPRILTTDIEPVASPVADWPKSVAFTSTSTFPVVQVLSRKDKKRILVTGGAGQSLPC